MLKLRRVRSRSVYSAYSTSDRINITNTISTTPGAPLDDLQTYMSSDVTKTCLVIVAQSICLYLNTRLILHPAMSTDPHHNQHFTIDLSQTTKHCLRLFTNWSVQRRQKTNYLTSINNVVFCLDLFFSLPDQGLSWALGCNYNASHHFMFCTIWHRKQNTVSKSMSELFVNPEQKGRHDYLLWIWQPI